MGKIKRVFSDDEFYHVYGRGIDSRITFRNENDIHRFLLGIVYFNNSKPLSSVRLLEQSQEKKIPPKYDEK